MNDEFSNVPFELVFKYLGTNCNKLGLSEEKVKHAINFLITTIGIDWFNKQYQKRGTNKTPMFYANPLIINSRSPIDTTLSELYYVSKYLHYFKDDKKIAHLIEMIKSDKIEDYYSVIFQLKVAFFISISKGKKVRLEPSNSSNIGDISFNLSNKQYVSEVSVLHETQIKNHLSKLNYLVMNSIHLKKLAGLQMTIKLTYKEKCYEKKLPNLFAELNKDIKLIINNITKHKIPSSPFAIVNEFYTLEISPFHKNEPSMPYIIEDNKVINYTNNWDMGTSLRIASIIGGKTRFETYEDLKLRDDTEIKFLSNFPKIDFKKELNRLKKKVQSEFSQLIHFSNVGKIIFLEVNDIYFENKANTEKELEGFIKNYSQLTSLILVRSSSLKYSEALGSCIVIKNEKNAYSPQERFYKLLKNR